MQTICIENMVGYGCRQVNIMPRYCHASAGPKVSWIETHLRDSRPPRLFPIR